MVELVNNALESGLVDTLNYPASLARASVLLASAVWCPEISAATHTAASCSESHVRTAMSLAVAGDTVLIPPGDCTWSTQVSWTAPANVTLRGAGSQSVIGGGDATIIRDGLTRGSDNAMLQISTHSSGYFRLLGITFAHAGSGNVTWNGSLRIFGNTTQLRIAYCTFNNIRNVTMLLSSDQSGVMDHNIFRFASSVHNGVRVVSSSFGDLAWASPTNLGTSGFIYLEDNQVSSGFVNDCITGGKFVIRFNTLASSTVQTHSTGSGARNRGCRAFEVYKNTFTGIKPDALYMTSGTGVVWGNTAASGYDRFMTVVNNLSSSSTYSQSPTPNGWGYCGTAQTGTSSDWNQNTDNTGYACLDQLGRGQGQLLTGDFPNVTNSSTGSIAWPNQALEPIYIWNNTTANTLLANNSSSVIAPNRDYYLGSGTFNGTTGMGVGTLASRPNTCTPGVGYWATDQGTWNQQQGGDQGVLFRCASTNNWQLHYTPYTYPHPLRSSGGTPPSVGPRFSGRVRVSGGVRIQ